MSENFRFATPLVVTNPADCTFYHSIELPEHGLIQGKWDLRQRIRQYLGNTDFSGKKVLDVGAATGFLTFSMEQQGAEVISYDLSPQHRWDIVPLGGVNWEKHLGQAALAISRVNNSYWFCHRALGSKAKMIHGTVYQIPEDIGQKDIVVLGSILCHLRDPILALHRALRLAKDQVIVADTIPRRRITSWLLAQLFGANPWLFPQKLNFLPRFEKGKVFAGWWDVSPTLVRQVLGLLGFEDSRTMFHHQKFDGSTRLTYTVVANRTKDTPPLEIYHSVESQAA